MQPKRLAAIFAIVTILVAACGKKGPSYTKYIPKDAAYVVALDIKGMVGKLEKDSLTVENMMQVLKDKADPAQYSKALEIWNQFKDAGLDFENKVFVAIPSFDMNGGNISVQVLAGLKDAKKLEEFIGKLPQAPSIQKEKGFSYAQKDDMIIGWTSDAVMILGGAPTPNLGAYSPDGNAPAPVTSGGEQLDKLKKYFALESSASIASVKEFEGLLAKKADLAIYTNSSSMATANPQLAAMPKVKELLEGIYSTSTFNFEDGKMVFEGDTYVGKKLADLLKKYTGPDLDMSLVDPYPSNNVNGVTAFSFKPELIIGLLKETGFYDLANMGVGQMGSTADEIVKAFKGDFAVIFSDFTLNKVEKEGYEGQKFTATEPSAKLLVAVRIGDKAAFDKLVAMAEKTQMIKREGNRLVPANLGDDDKVTIGIENDLLVFSTDAETYKAYVAKTAKIGLSDADRSSIKGNASAMFIDAGKILAAIPESIFDSTDSHEKNILVKSQSIFKTMLFTVSNFDGKKINGKGEVVLASNKNSLSQLVSYLMYVAEEMKQKDAEQTARYKAEFGSDDEAADTTAPGE